MNHQVLINDTFRTRAGSGENEIQKFCALCNSVAEELQDTLRKPQVRTSQHVETEGCWKAGTRVGTVPSTAGSLRKRGSKTRIPLE